MGHVPVIAGLRYVSVRLPSLASMVCYLLNQLVRQRGLGKRRACLVVQNKLRLATAVADNSPKASATTQPRHPADSQSHSSDSLLRLNRPRPMSAHSRIPVRGPRRGRRLPAPAAWPPVHYFGLGRLSAPTAVSLSLAQRRRRIENPAIMRLSAHLQEMASLLNRPPPKP
jgi:hypothetical protein